MDLQTETLVRKPFFVGAIQVTEENMKEVAKWCGGRINTTPPPRKDESDRVVRRYIRMPVPLNRNGRGRAYAGDWILNMGESFQAYTDTALWKFFDRPTPAIPLKEQGERRIVPATPNRVFERFFKDVEYDSDKDALVYPQAIIVSAKKVAEKINSAHQEEQNRAHWEKLIRTLVADGPGVFKDYSMECFLDGVKIGKDLPEGHDCFKKSCTVEEMPDWFYANKRIYKIYHKHLTDISEEIPPGEEEFHFKDGEGNTTFRRKHIGSDD